MTDGGSGASCVGPACTTRSRLAVPPPLDAEMVVAPGQTPVATPVLVTVATAADELLQLTVAPTTTLPSPSRSVAESCWASPTRSVSAAAAKAMLETGSGSVTPLPSLHAVAASSDTATAAGRRRRTAAGTIENDTRASATGDMPPPPRSDWWRDHDTAVRRATLGPGTATAGVCSGGRAASARRHAAV